MRENASEQVAIGFSFASDWLRKWREFSRPITESITIRDYVLYSTDRDGGAFSQLRGLTSDFNCGAEETLLFVNLYFFGKKNFFFWGGGGAF